MVAEGNGYNQSKPGTGYGNYPNNANTYGKNNYERDNTGGRSYGYQNNQYRNNYSNGGNYNSNNNYGNNRYNNGPSQNPSYHNNNPLSNYQSCNQKLILDNSHKASYYPSNNNYPTTNNYNNPINSYTPGYVPSAISSNYPLAYTATMPTYNNATYTPIMTNVPSTTYQTTYVGQVGSTIPIHHPTTIIAP